jgi:ribonuclease G
MQLSGGIKYPPLLLQRRYNLKEILIERNENILRIAITENKLIVECLIEEENLEPVPGQIYKGIVKNIIPSMKCAFIDIGFEKNCYMYMDRKFNNTSIKKNDEIVVEILKEAVGDKGPKVTSAITIPGRNVVLETLSNEINFSKKITNEIFKSSIKNSIKIPENVGLMIRTNAEHIPVETINGEIEKLYEIYKKVIAEAAYSVKPRLLFSGEGVLDKILRDYIDVKVESIVVNNEKDYDYIKDYLKLIPELNCKLELYKNSISLFNFHSVESSILELRNNRVNLPSGGYIIIDKTEAMYVIDVNSGKNVSKSSMDKAIFNINMEAAREICRQIKLRNLSGIIVIDFIDMDNYLFKDKVFQEMKKGFEEDRGKSVVYPFTQLNLVQISRKRLGKPITEFMEEKCSCCAGRGNRLRLSYLSILIRNEVLKMQKDYNANHIHIEIGNHYKDEIMKDTISFIEKINCLNMKVYASFIKDMEFFKIDALIFQNQIENMQKIKIYG